MRLFFVIALFCLCNTDASAQDLRSIFSGIAKSLVGDKATNDSSIIGTWTYVGPDCQFESDNLLAKAGGKVASNKIKEKLAATFDKIGMQGTTYTFNEDGTYSSKFGKVASSGTYTFDAKEKTIKMKTRLGISSTAHVIVTGSSMSLLYESNKLYSALKMFSNLTSKLNSSGALINSLANSYDGIQLGFELKKD